LLEPKGIILDLRNNGGGYLEIAVDILSEFIEGKKKAVSIERRNHEDDQTMYLKGNPRLANIPLVVLINGGSASASEIVAGAIQDYKRGTILGETSFGKGSVQEVFKLNDGSSIRLTIAKWLTPDGNHIDETGIEPDIVVEFTNEDTENDDDPQLNAALEYLKNL
jgi:carboxyl-terminal processing protease